MKLIVGLGNPGTSYADTRHNAGRLLVEAIVRKEGLKWSRKKSLHASVAAARWNNEEILLARPEVFMNLSGEAVASLVHENHIEFSRDLLIAVDDTALPFGRLRLRGRGSDGGHNGLKSISRLLASPDYPRLRIGVAPPGETEKIPDMAGYVLEEFSPQEKQEMDSLLEKGMEACRLWALDSLAAAMNAVNPRKI